MQALPLIQVEFHTDDGSEFDERELEVGLVFQLTHPPVIGDTVTLGKGEPRTVVRRYWSRFDLPRPVLSIGLGGSWDYPRHPKNHTNDGEVR